MPDIPAPRVYGITVTVPAGTPIASPVSVPWVTEDNTIVDIEIEVPPGHNGLTGIRIVKGGTQLIPYSANSFITANNYTRVFPIGAFIPTGDVTIQAYNTGLYPHSFYLRMTVTNYYQHPGGVTGSPDQAIPAGSITVAPDPLSPDAILGSDTANALTSGQLTASDVVPVITENLTVPPVPQPTGL